MKDQFLTDDEQIELTFRAHWRSGLLGMTTAVLLGVGGTVLGMWIDDDPGSSFLWGGLIGLGIGLATAAIITSQSLVEWLTTRYWVTSERLVVRTGLFTRKGREIPVDTINSVAVRQNAIERLLGFGDMAVESAGANSLQTFKNIPQPQGAQKAIYEARERRMLHLSGGGGRGIERGRYADLADLADLRDRGILSEEEFAVEKAKVLGSAATTPPPPGDESPPALVEPSDPTTETT